MSSRSKFVVFALSAAVGLSAAGCNPAATPGAANPNESSSKAALQRREGVAGPIPQTIKLPDFRVTHQEATIVTIVVKVGTSVEELESLLWTLHEADRSHSFRNLKISQTLIDERNPMVWFQIYRTDRCSAEHYTDGKLPCGSKEHEAAWYSLGNFADRNADGAVVYHGEEETDGEKLWGPGRPAPASFHDLVSTTRPIDHSETQPKGASLALFDDLSTMGWAGGHKAGFTQGNQRTAMNVSADWLVSKEKQDLLKLGLRFQAARICKQGFKSALMVPFPGEAGVRYDLPCHR